MYQCIMYYTLIDWYEGNSKFVVPLRHQLLHDVKGTINLLLPEYPVCSKCFIILNRIRAYSE